MGTKKKHGISRRTFIKGTAATGACMMAGTAGELLSEGPHEAKASPPLTSGTAAPPPPIPASDISKVITTEVMIVGAGTSGMAAALSAVEAGARVTLIEKGTTFRAFGGHK